jgi:hypothetical protein
LDCGRSLLFTSTAQQTLLVIYSLKQSQLFYSFSIASTSFRLFNIAKMDNDHPTAPGANRNDGRPPTPPATAMPGGSEQTEPAGASFHTITFREQNGAQLSFRMKGYSKLGKAMVCSMLRMIRGQKLTTETDSLLRP